MEASELDALIATNIGDLEAALARARDHVDPNLNAAAWSTLRRALGEADYFFDEDDDLDEAWFAPRRWITDADSDPWFRLTARDGSALETWLACYLAPRSRREAIGIQWYQESLYVRDYKAILAAHADELAQIENAGFQRDGTDIYLPIAFDAATFARGLEDGDLSEALVPITEAASALTIALPSFERLRDAMVAKAKL